MSTKKLEIKIYHSGMKTEMKSWRGKVIGTDIDITCHDEETLRTRLKQKIIDLNNVDLDTQQITMKRKWYVKIQSKQLNDDSDDEFFPSLF